ncbi:MULTISPECIES: hypothetical protein [Arenibacter]|uniref:hypothetical protein n=1 Tax=Arenibacter TaxID=178469 RepID=UPI0004DF5A9C|nr:MULTISPECIES: hypothetical protein [Arenibacter]GBF19531.1 hypothetical protein C21_01699 [Arenibacter sp. NBRC 103722]
MDATTFKTEIKNLKDFLVGKTITVSLVNGNNITKYDFSTLKGFGKAILAFEGMGANFGFIKVGNSLIEKRTKDIKELNHYINNGVWDSVHFLATTIKN